MKTKIFFLTCSLFLLSGCTLNYKINIDKNNVVTEKVSIKEANSILSTYTLDVDQYVENSLNIYKERKQFNTYSLSIDSDEEYYYGTATRKYIDLENYKNNSIIVSEMFKEVIVNEKDGIVTFEMNPKNSFEYFNEDSLNTSLFDEANIEIYVPYEMISSNQDKIEDNVYIWNIKNDEDLKKIYIKYNTKKKLKTPIPRNVLIISGIALFVVGLFISIYIKYKRNGR